METADQKWCWRMWSHICQMDQLILLLWLQLIHQRSQACCSPWGHNELDTTDQLNCTELNLSAISSAEACGISCRTGPAPRHWVCNLHPYPECDFSAGHQSPRERSWRKPILLPNYHSRRAERSQELLGIFQSRCMGGWMRCFLVKVLFHFPEASPQYHSPLFLYGVICVYRWEWRFSHQKVHNESNQHMDQGSNSAFI